MQTISSARFSQGLKFEVVLQVKVSPTLWISALTTEFCIVASFPDAVHDSDCVEQTVPTAARQTSPHPSRLEGLEDAQVKFIVDEPRMLQALVRTHPVLRLAQEQLRDEIFGAVSGPVELALFERVVALDDLLHGAEPVDGEEGGDASGEELVRDDADPPAVGGGRRHGLVHDLGRHVLESAAKAHLHPSRLIRFPGQAEIDDLEVVVVFFLHEDDVERFEIQMDVVVPVDVLDSTTDLLGDKISLFHNISLYKVSVYSINQSINSANFPGEQCCGTFVR